MAREEQPKQPWYKLIWQAYKTTQPYDKLLLPLLIGIPVVLIALGTLIGLAIGGTLVLVYAIVTAVLVAVLADLFVLTRRFETVAFRRIEGQVGASIYVAQSLRSGWQFADEPVAFDPRRSHVVFRGVGKRGVVLLSEGGAAGYKAAQQQAKRVEKLVSGVDVAIIRVGSGEGEVPVSKLTKAIKGVKSSRKYNAGERQAIESRLKAMGGMRPPVPKGIDPLSARPDRKAMRGR